MRNPKRIDTVLKELGELWKKCPDLRLGQLLSNCVDLKISEDEYKNIESINKLRHLRLYNLEENELLLLIKQFKALHGD